MIDHHPDRTYRLRRAALRGDGFDGPPSNLGRQLDARIAMPHGQGARFHIAIPLEP